MSKQSEAKAAQGYVPKVVPQVCGNCANFEMELKRFNNFGELVECGSLCDYERETNLRCAVGGFAVKKMATCKLWKPTKTK